MSRDYRKLSLAETVAEAEAVTRTAQAAFGQFNAAQLNWKPNAESWSVGQCLEHLINANREMFQPLDKVINGRKQTRLLERLPLLPGLMGGMMIKAVAPETKQKLKAPPKARPSSSAIDAEIVSHFAAHQHELIGRLQELEKYEVDKIIVTSPFVSLITYSLLDACRLIVAHERRHLAQARAVMAMPGFPR
jgi:hypothetical protein